MENTELECNEKKNVAGIYIRVSTEDQANLQVLQDSTRRVQSKEDEPIKFENNSQNDKEQEGDPIPPPRK